MTEDRLLSILEAMNSTYIMKPGTAHINAAHLEVAPRKG